MRAQDNKINRAVGEHFRRARESLGWTLEDVSRRVEQNGGAVSLSALSRFERGLMTLSLIDIAMSRTRARIVLCLLLFVVLVQPIARSEVAVSSAGDRPAFLMSGGDDPDPFPSWTVTREYIEQFLALDTTGDQNGDGLAAFAVNPTTENPEVVWSWWDGHDHEIAYSRWSGTEWTVPEIVTDNDTEDTRPTIAMGSDGARHISWWRSGSGDQVYYLWKPATGGTGPEEIVTNVGAGTRPGIAFGADGPRVGYQEPQSSGTTLVVVAHKSATGWEPVTLASTTYTGPLGDGDLDVQAHALGSRKWVDWVSGPGELGYATYDPASASWSAPQFVPYSWNLATGVSERTAREFGRISIRALVRRP